MQSVILQKNLKEYETKILGAEEKIQEIEQKFFLELFNILFNLYKQCKKMHK